jgi:hypothetical protein
MRATARICAGYRGHSEIKLDHGGTEAWCQRFRLPMAFVYGLAKLFEFYDREIYSLGSVLSGHTIKHFAAAAACYVILRYFQTFRAIKFSPGIVQSPDPAAR